MKAMRHFDAVFVLFIGVVGEFASCANDDRTRLTIPTGTFLRVIPIGVGGNDMKDVIGHVKAIKGISPDASAHGFCYRYPLLESRLNVTRKECLVTLTKHLTLQGDLEITRRSKELERLSDLESHHAATFAQSMGSGEPAHLRESVRSLQSLGIQSRTEITYAALDAAHGWTGNAGMNHIGFAEGYCSPEQAQSWARLAAALPDGAHVCQTGFNGGHSAAVLLMANPRISMTSFDIGQGFMSAARDVIFRVFGDRHNLVLGDSKVTLPLQRPPPYCDLILIDGDHRYATVIQDIMNFQPLASCDAIVMLDDWRDEDVLQAVKEAQEQGILLQHTGVLPPAKATIGTDPNRRCKGGCSTLSARYSAGGNGATCKTSLSGMLLLHAS